MKVVICLPLPYDNWDEFAPFIKRFCDTYRQFPPGVDCELWAIQCWGDRKTPVTLNLWWFDGIKNGRFVDYFETGCNIGSAQHAAEMQNENCFMVLMTSRCYFYREGWLKRLLEAREKHGNGLYGVSASWETGTPHICNRAFCMDSETFSRYPHIVDTREKTVSFETGDWCITTWYRDQSLPCYQVTLDGEQEQSEWRKPENIFRKGDQSNMLVWDKHTDNYRDSDAAEKLRLAAMADGNL